MKNLIKSNIYIIASILLVIVFILGALYFSSRNSRERGTLINGTEREEYANNISVVDGKQIIKITAKGGFTPIHSIAKANLPTILRVDTNGTFDCSSVIRIPELNISKNLPMTGTTDIDIGVEKAGTFQGTCGMGMYPFDIKFE